MARPLRYSNISSRMTSAWLFTGNHRIRGHVSGDIRDHYEATLLGNAFDRHALIGVMYSCAGMPCWTLGKDRYVFEKGSADAERQKQQWQRAQATSKHSAATKKKYPHVRD